MAPSTTAFLALACWTVLVSLSYIRAHEGNLSLALEAIKVWSLQSVTFKDAAATIPGHVRGIGAAAFCGALCWMSGMPAARWFGARGAPIGLALGMGVLILIFLGAGLTGLFYPILLLTAAAAAGAAGFSRRKERVESGGARTPEAIIPSWMAWCLLGIASASGAANLLGALAPEVGYDSLIQHLADPARYLAAHRVFFNDLSFLSQHPAGLQMIYALLLFLGGDAGPMVFHWGLGLLTAWGFHIWVARYWHSRDALIFASALYMTPFLGILSCRAYVDLGLMFYSVCALLAPWGTWLQGAMLGMGIGVKYSGGLLLAGWLAAVGLRRGGGPAAARVAAGAGLACLWWGARNWLNSGNPVYPFLYSLFGGLGWDSVSAAEYLAEVESYGRVAGTFAHIAIPWLTFVRDRGALDNGSLGPVLLILAPLALLVRVSDKHSRLIGGFAVLAASLWCLYCVSPRQVRYALPYLPPTFALMTCLLRRAWSRWPWAVRPAVALMGVLLTVQAGVSLAAIYLWANPYAVVVGSMSRGEYLSRIIPPYDPDTGNSLYMASAHRLAETMPEGADCLLIGDGKVYYIPGKWRVNALFNPRILKRMVQASSSADDVAKRFKERGITHLLYNVGGSIHLEYTHRLYDWTDRQELVMEGFFRRWLRQVWRLETAAGEPMYIFFEIRAGDYPYPPYLPGVDTAIAGIEQRYAEGDIHQARAKARELLARYPASIFLPARLTDILANVSR